MASPQKEFGYTPISNELMEALASFRIPGECRQVFDLIVRKTYGFNKKADFISISQFVDFCGIKKGNVCRALNGLLDHKLVIKTDNKYSIQKDYTVWLPFGKGVYKPVDKHILGVIKSDNRVIVSDNKSLSKASTTKDNKRQYTKDNNNSPIKIGDILNTKYKNKNLIAIKNN